MILRQNSETASSYSSWSASHSEDRTHYKAFVRHPVPVSTLGFRLDCSYGIALGERLSI